MKPEHRRPCLLDCRRIEKSDPQGQRTKPAWRNIKLKLGAQREPRGKSPGGRELPLSLLVTFRHSPVPLQLPHFCSRFQKCNSAHSRTSLFCSSCVLCLVIQLCPTFCDAMDCSPPGSCVHGILQARILEWVAMPSSRGSSQPRD